MEVAGAKRAKCGRVYSLVAVHTAAVAVRLFLFSRREAFEKLCTVRCLKRLFRNTRMNLQQKNVGCCSQSFCPELCQLSVLCSLRAQYVFTMLIVLQYPYWTSYRNIGDFISPLSNTCQSSLFSPALSSGGEMVE